MAQTVLEVFKDELRLTHLLLNHGDEQAFYCSQWRIPHFVYVILKVILAGYSIFAYTDLLVVSGVSGSFVFFTVWSYTILVLHLCYTAFLSIIFYKRAVNSTGEVEIPHKLNGVHRRSVDTNGFSTSNHNTVNGEAVQPTVNPTINGDSVDQNGHAGTPSPEEEVTVSASSTHSAYESFQPFPVDSAVHKSAWYFKVSWVGATLIYCAAPVVTIIYLTTIYPSIYKNGGPLNLQDTNVHALNLVFVFVDHAITGRPIRLLHAVYAMMYGLLYVLFSVIYWGVDHSHVIYKILDWNSPGPAIGVSIGLIVVAIPLLQLMYFGLHQLKLFLCRKFKIGRKSLHT